MFATLRRTALVVGLLVAVVALPSAPAGATTIEASITPTVMLQGTTASVKGGTSGPARPGITVALERRLPGNVWSTRAFATADGAGKFSIPIKPTGVGVYALRVRTAYGYSPVFYVRVLAGLVLDPGGLQDLRVGMTLNQAKATHWVTGTSGGCPVDVGSQALTFQPAVQSAGVAGELRSGRIAWLALRKAPGRTREGLKVGGLASQLGAIYPAPTWQVHIGPIDPSFGVKFVEIRRAGTTWYEAVIDPATDRIAEIDVPFTPTCD